jgi:DNA-directed RNA polymerases I, II, and III subunit RPABC2
MNVITDFFGITEPDENVKQDTPENSLEEGDIDENAPTTDDEEDKDDEDKEEDKEEDEEDDEDIDDDIDDADSDGEDLQKLQGYEERNVLVNYHPEVMQISEEELQTYTRVVRDDNGTIIDPFHKTIPIMTKYEKAKIIGIRAQQINSGSEPFINVDINMIDGLSIANEELLQKKIPFIIRRPIPNGSSEYWNATDLEILE